jgi:outer membrane protein assembly factor BamA
VKRGERSTIAGVDCIGLTNTRLSTAQTLSGLRVGDPWSIRSGEAALRRFGRLRIFSRVSSPVLTMVGENEVRVLFDVTEGRANSFDGVLGYLPPPPGSRRGTVTGLVNLQFRNVFGTARRLGARWYQERQGRHEVGIEYREPAVAGWPVSGQLNLFQRRQDSVYVRFDITLAFDAEVGLDMFAGLTLSASTTNPVEGFGQSIVPQSSTTLLGARFGYDTRDRPFPARKGALYSTSLSAGSKRSTFFGATTAYGVQRLSFDAGYYHPTFLFQSIAVEAHWREVKGGGTDISDLYRLGGSTTVRGYRENEFVGSRVLWQTTEYRLFLSPTSYVGGFVDLARIDVGRIAGTTSLPASLFRVGYGVTALVDTPVGSVGLSLALGEGDGLGDAKLHVRLMTEF